MPAKNVIKVYAENSFYHIYNRGANKDAIFRDKSDYVFFLHLFKKYLDPEFKEKIFDPVTNEVYLTEGRTFIEDTQLLAFVLMPNHFHLFAKTLSKGGIVKFMRALSISYSMFFNKKYDRVGRLFQGTYKAVRVKSEEQMLHLSCYIHLNPVEIIKGRGIESYEFSSFPYYIGKKESKWVHPKILLDMFYNSGGYTSYADLIKGKLAESDELIKILYPIIMEPVVEV